LENNKFSLLTPQKNKSNKKTHIKAATKSDGDNNDNNNNDEIGVGQLRSSVHSVGQTINPCLQDNDHSCIISVDSGHSLISGPPDVIKRLKAELDVPGLSSCSDEVIASMPDVSFMIGGKLFTLKPTDYLVKFGGSCAPAFIERTVRNGHDWILGEHFMRSFYTVFDHDNMRIGFSHLAHTKKHLSKILQSSKKDEE